MVKVNLAFCCVGAQKYKKKRNRKKEKKKSSHERCGAQAQDSVLYQLGTWISLVESMFR